MERRGEPKERAEGNAKANLARMESVSAQALKLKGSDVGRTSISRDPGRRRDTGSKWQASPEGPWAAEIDGRPVDENAAGKCL
ncbi:hypothetical protein GCM10017674_73310 [Streptomyces gardneri]|nr:hypothetical protein GCM10017674_73310 [Streptomyces gardneri]